MTTKIVDQIQIITPEVSQYLKVARSTTRFRLLQQLAAEFGCRWQEVARVAIDDYLDKKLPHPPKKV